MVAKVKINEINKTTMESLIGEMANLIAYTKKSCERKPKEYLLS